MHTVLTDKSERNHFSNIFAAAVDVTKMQGDMKEFELNSIHAGISVIPWGTVLLTEGI